MMRRYLYLPMLLTVIGCTVDEQIDSVDLVPITISASVDVNMATRAATDVLSSSQFGTGETFYAYFPTNVKVGAATSSCGTAFTTDGTGATTPATQPYFNGGVSSADVYAYYPYADGKQVTQATTSFSVEQDQSTTVGYKKSDLMYATTSVTKNGASSSANLTFTHRMARIVVNLTIGDGLTAVSGVRIVGGSKTIAIANAMTTDESQSAFLGSVSSAAADLLSTSSYISLYSDTYSSTETPLQCAGLIPPQTVTGDFLQVLTPTGTATYSLNSKAFAGGQSYTYNVTVNATSLGVTTDITDWNTNPETSLYDVGASSMVEAVDLGIVVNGERILFANMNVGANSPTDYGNYYCWGGTTPVNDTSIDLGWNSNCPFWASGSTASSVKFTKYVPSGMTSYWGGSGSPDNKLVLDPEDDAATVNWGRPWRMPTIEEFEALINNTDVTYGPDYFVFTNKSDASKYIIFTKGGNRNSIYFDSPDLFGNYWSSSVRSGSGSPERALYLDLCFINGNYYRKPNFYDRPNGMLVRPVCVKEPEAVDLGLPSGTKWANMNLGAGSETDYGAYFAWGETIGYTASESHNFNEANYKWYNGSTYTKYNSTDNKTVLDLEDDVAHVQLGGNWHIPTMAEWQELNNSSYTTSIWTTRNGVEGMLITSKINGNSIFLPAAGQRAITDVNWQGKFGLYWVNTGGGAGFAGDIVFEPDGMGINPTGVWYGEPVRPVLGN